MNTFKAAQFMTAADKALTLRQWKTFLKKLAADDGAQLTGADYGYFPAALDRAFSDRLYKFLSLYAGFIAHYNRRGFLSARFTNDDDIRATFQQLRERQYWGGYSDVADLGAAFVRAMDETGDAFPRRWARTAAREEAAERAELERLQKKYENPAAPSRDNSLGGAR